MPDVFSVLSADHAQVRQMLLALENSPGCSAGAGQSVLAARKEVVARLVIDSARQQAAQAELLRPAVRDRLGWGGRLAGQATARQRGVRAVLARLGQLEPTDEEFDRLVAELIVTARRHLDFEEARVWPALRQVLSHAEAQELGGTMERARQHRLLRPRPRRNYVARRPGGAVILSGMTAQDDRQAAPLDLSTAVGLAQALRDLLHASAHLFDSASPAAVRIGGHLGCELTDMAAVGERFPMWEHANVQRGIDACLAGHSPEAEWFGISGRWHDEDLVAMITSYGSQITAVAHGTAAIGPDEVMEVVQGGLVPSVAPDGAPIIISVRATDQFGEPSCRVDVLAAQRATAVAARERIDRLIRERDVFRGQVLSFGVSEHRGNELLSFLPRPRLGADQVILPPGLLDSVERHVIDISRHAAQLRAAGQHLKRGLLLHGVPGTGKTHTVRYLLSRMTDCTVILMTGQAMGYIEGAAALARRLQPSVLVLEDVDLVAEDRDFSDGNPLLFTLLDAMDGVGADADVTFVLTTNRADVLERALAERPGRVDLAVEIPRPDREARARLLRLYAGDLRLDADLTPVIEATEGVTASYIKELLRRAVLAAIRASGEARVLTDADLGGAAAELAAERESLTRALLGHAAQPDPVGPHP